MPTVKPILRRRMRMFTKADYLKGKCTKEGFALEGAENVPDESPTPSVDPIPDTSTETASPETVTSGPDVAVDLTLDDNEETSEAEDVEEDAEEERG